MTDERPDQLFGTLAIVPDRGAWLVKLDDRLLGTFWTLDSAQKCVETVMAVLEEDAPF